MAATRRFDPENGVAADDFAALPSCPAGATWYGWLVMQIQVNTDNKIDAPEKLADHVRAVIEKTLKNVGDHVTRVEVHLTQDGHSSTLR